MGVGGKIYIEMWRDKKKEMRGSREVGHENFREKGELVREKFLWEWKKCLFLKQKCDDCEDYTLLFCVLFFVFLVFVSLV